MIPFYNVACYQTWQHATFLKGVTNINCERHLGGYLRAISNAMAQDMQQNSEQLGLTATQGMFLHHLWFRQENMHVPTYAKDLEDFFDIKHSTVSGVLQRMEAAGFVQFQENVSDRRCKAIHLTQKGMDAHEQTGQHIRQTEAKLIEGMTKSETAEFRRLLQIAAGNLGVCMPHFPKRKKEVTDP